MITFLDVYCPTLLDYFTLFSFVYSKREERPRPKCFVRVERERERERERSIKQQLSIWIMIKMSGWQSTHIPIITPHIFSCTCTHQICMLELNYVACINCERLLSWKLTFWWLWLSKWKLVRIYVKTILWRRTSQVI